MKKKRTRSSMCGNNNNNSTTTAMHRRSSSQLYEICKMDMERGAELLDAAAETETSSSSDDSSTAATSSCTAVPLQRPQDDEQDNDIVLLSSALSNLSSCTQKYGECHGKTAECWNSLGLIRLHMQQNYPEARLCHEHALDIYQRLNDCIQTAITLCDLGLCCEKLNQQDQAIQYYQRALSTLSQQCQFDASHPRMIATQRNMNRLLRA